MFDADDHDGPPGLSRCGTLTPVDRKIWTAAEFEKLSPAEQDAIFEDGIIWNLEDAPPDLVAKARESILERIAATEGSDVEQ